MNSRRDNVPFDAYAFEQAALRGTTYSMSATFRRIHQSNHWRGTTSVSGEGANPSQTVVLPSALNNLVSSLRLKTLLDAPCGDFSWMKDADLPLDNYIGMDIVEELICSNQDNYASQRRHFIQADLTQDALPSADMLLCRDCLVHFSFADIGRTLKNIRSSQIKYFLFTTFPGCQHNENIVTGDWRVLNLQRAPFNFPEPLQLINEGCTEGSGEFHDKSLGLWLIEDLPACLE